METPVHSQQTLVANKDQGSKASHQPSVGADRLFETEISVKQTDNNGIGDVSVVQASSSSQMRGRKSNNKDTIFSNGKADVDAKFESKEEEEEEDNVEGERHEFSVGDFVWAKIKSYPWWPGQIYSPSDASTTAAKYKRRNRLLVACFGDKTFAWCYPFQLKPFQENFDQLVKESNSKSFSLAVEEAVDEIGRRLDMEMACSCLAVERRPVEPVVVNAGIKEGVAVPDGEIGELSINQFDPAIFLSHIKCIAQTVSVNNVLEILVLRARLSGFYRTKGYYRLPEYHEPVRIFVPSDPVENGLASDDKGEDLIKDVTGTSEEAEWLTSSAVPEVGSTGITISRRLSSISEDKLLQSKKQRSVADLMAEEKEGSVYAKPRGRPKKIKDNIGSEIGSDVAEELAISGKEASLAEEGTISPKAGGRSKKRREDKDSEEGKDATEELLMSDKARSRPMRKRENIDLNMDSEIGNDFAKELTISGKEGSLAEEGTISAKTRGKPKKTRENKDPGGGTDVDEAANNVRSNFAEEISISGKQAPLAEEGTMSARPRGRPKKTGENTGSKSGTNVATEFIKALSDVAEEMTISGKQAPLAEEVTASTTPRGRPKKTSGNIGSEGGIGVAAELNKVGRNGAEEMTVSGKHTPLDEEGTTTAKPRGRPRKKRENESEVVDDIDVVKRLPFFDKLSADSKKRKRNKDSVVGKERGVDGESSEKQTAASGVKNKKVDSGLGNNSGLVQEGYVNAEHALSPNKAPNVDKDDLSFKERSSSSLSLRERKKSKYLSPPYTLLRQWKKNGIPEDNSKMKTSNISSNSIGGDSGIKAVGQSAIWPPIVKCSGETFHRELSQESRPNLTASGPSSPFQPNKSHQTTEESNVSAHEMLSDFRSAALDPLYLTKKQSDDSIKGFFTKYRSSLYQEGSDFTVHNNHLAGRGSRKRVSFDMKSGIPGNGGSESGYPISEGENERKKSKRKEGERSPKTSKHVNVASDMKMNPKGNFSGDSSVAVLLITFAEGVTLPSKHALITTFSAFGELKESETEVIEDSGCAQVVFARRSDAEEAYKSSDKISSFGSSVVSYRLRYVPVVSRTSDNVENPHPDHHSSSLPGKEGNAPIVQSAPSPQVSEVPPLQSVKQNLQMATSALENVWDKLSSDLKASLDTEIKGFLSKVTSMVEPSSF